MRRLRRAFIRWLIAVSVLATTFAGSAAERVDAVRYEHVWCATHDAVEHRDDGQAQPVDDDRSDHGLCGFSHLIAAAPPTLAVRVGALAVVHPCPAPTPLTGGATPRAPPLSFAPKTSPPA